MKNILLHLLAAAVDTRKLYLFIVIYYLIFSIFSKLTIQIYHNIFYTPYVTIYVLQV